MQGSPELTQIPPSLAAAPLLQIAGARQSLSLRQILVPLSCGARGRAGVAQRPMALAQYCDASQPPARMLPSSLFIVIVALFVFVSSWIDDFVYSLEKTPVDVSLQRWPSCGTPKSLSSIGGREYWRLQPPQLYPNHA